MSLIDRVKAAADGFKNPNEKARLRYNLSELNRHLEREVNHNLDLLSQRQKWLKVTAVVCGLAPSEFVTKDSTIADIVEKLVDALAEARSQLAPIVTDEELENYDPDFGYFPGEEPELEQGDVVPAPLPNYPRIVIPDEKPPKKARKSSTKTTTRKPKKPAKKAARRK